jgi:hypothetical protein
MSKTIKQVPPIGDLIGKQGFVRWKKLRLFGAAAKRLTHHRARRAASREIAGELREAL